MSLQDETSSVKVSICCITYNHAQYIGDAIQGFLSQEVNFPIEILIHDDASTDGTQEIIRKYEKQYPEIIKVIYQKNNQFSQGVDPFGDRVYPLAQGKYIALCDGDDFWTDPQKLKKQVRFLDNNPDYVMCGHDAYIFNDTGVIASSKLPDVHKKSATSKQLKKGRFVLTLSACFRNIGVPLPEEYSRVYNSDTFLFSWLGSFGKYKYMPDIKPAAYRAHSGGIWSLLDSKQQESNLLASNHWISQYYKRVGDDDVSFDFAAKNFYLTMDSLHRISLKSAVYLLFLVFKIFFKKNMPELFNIVRSARDKVPMMRPEV